MNNEEFIAFYANNILLNKFLGFVYLADQYKDKLCEHLRITRQIPKTGMFICLN